MTDQQLASYTARTAAELRELRHGLVSSLYDAGMAADRIDEVVVMASELVANVLGHTDSAANVTVTAEPEHLRVAVADSSADLPVLRPADPRRLGGNGLRIVDVVADDWGTINHPDNGKEVWFTRRLH